MLSAGALGISGMMSETPMNFVVYNITSYFRKQPLGLECCPACGKSISSAGIPPSRAVASELELGDGALPVYDFSYLYKCQTCSWWGIRESWAFLESSGTNDCLVVAREDDLEISEPPIQPWKQALENPDLYKRMQPLPENLGKLFIGGESYASLAVLRKSLWNDVQEFAVNYARSKTQKK